MTKVTNKKKLWQFLIEHHVNHRADCNSYAFDDNNAFLVKNAGQGANRLKGGRRIPVDYPHDPVVFCDQGGWTMVGDLLSVVQTVAIMRAKAIVGQQASGVLQVPDAIAWVQSNLPQTFVGLASRVLGVEFGSGTSCAERERHATPGQAPATVAGWYPLADKTHFGPLVTQAIGGVIAVRNNYEAANGRGLFQAANSVAKALEPGTDGWQATMLLDNIVIEKFHTLETLPNARKLLNGTSPWFPCVQAIGLGEYREDRAINIEMSSVDPAAQQIPRTEPQDGRNVRYDLLLKQGGIPLASYNLLRDAHWVFLSCENCEPGGNARSAFAFAHEVPDGAYARAADLPWNAEWGEPSRELTGMPNARGGYLYMILCCSSGAGVGAELGIRTAMLACSLGYTRYVLAAAPAPASLYYKSGLRFCNRRTGEVVDTSAFESPPGSGRLVTSATLPRARGAEPPEGWNARAVGGLSQS